MSAIKKTKAELLDENKKLKKQIAKLKSKKINTSETADKERIYQKAIENSPISIIITDSEGKIEFVNPFFSKLTGYSPKEVIGKNPNVLSSGHHPPKFYKDLWETIKKGKVWQGEFLNTKKSGVEYWESATISPVFNSEGKITHFVGTKKDITERKRAEAELQKSGERFRRLVENAPEIIYRFRIQPDPGFEFISPAVIKISGYTPQEYYDNPELGFQIIHPEDRSKLNGIFKGIIPKSPHQVRWIRKDGKIIWTEDRTTPIYNEKGEIIAIEGIAREITAQREAEEALKEAYDIIDKSPAIPFLWKNEEG